MCSTKDFRFEERLTQAAKRHDLHICMACSSTFNSTVQVAIVTISTQVSSDLPPQAAIVMGAVALTATSQVTMLPSPQLAPIPPITYEASTPITILGSFYTYYYDNNL